MKEIKVNIIQLIALGILWTVMGARIYQVLSIVFK